MSSNTWRIVSALLPYVFNSSQGAGTPNKSASTEYASSYGSFKPTYYASFLPPRSDEQAQHLYNHVRTVAWYLDALPYLTHAGLPFRIGLDDIISAIPLWGDFIGVILAFYQVFLSFLFGVPYPILGRMAINVGIDLVLGILPILGDVLDTLFKSNLRNLALLEEWLLTGSHSFTIEVTPNDEFLPKKNARPASSSGFSNFFSRATGTNASTSATDADAKAKYRTNAPKGTRRFNRAELPTEDLD